MFRITTILKIDSKKIKHIKGLPESPRLANFRWSHDEEKIAFTHTTGTGVELWYIDLAKQRAKKLSQANINANMRSTINWFKDDKSLLVKILPATRKPLINSEEATPTGPIISVSDGAKAQNRTYQDLLKSPADEYNFVQLALSELHRIDLNGSSQIWKQAAMYSSIPFSPDGDYVSVTQVQKPFSYIVPYSRFPQQTDIVKADGKYLMNFNKVPLIEEIPKGFMSVRKGKRNLQWRSDQGATMVWVEALDEGDAEKSVPYRDEVYQVKAPFSGQATSLFKTEKRFFYITWGDAQHAIFSDYWWNTRMISTSLFNPSDLSIKPKLLSERNYQDVYSDPGSYVTKRNNYGRHTLEIDGDTVYLMGDGYTDKGQFPFIDSLNLTTNKTERLYQSTLTDSYEDLRDAIDLKNGKVLIRKESPTEYPNYYIRDFKQNKLQQITDFNNPFVSLAGIHKEVIKYPRADGLELSGTLYLPADYKSNTKLPMILWAYPEEFKDKNSASQNTNNPNRFTYPYYGSMLYWVMLGYAVLDDASFPIVGEGDEEPNDSFIKQLVANGKAAIDALDDLGYIDRNRVAVGGHSYGAFMVANLLSHSDLFAAGIARSGAYNRTLTPFGFQSEERSYWDAPEIYYNMSPFMHADTMNSPLLLIHGEADNNSGTYPLQSERYFNALKGLGATARLVMLPKESHGYRAKESILHLLWEQDQWLEKHVKNKK